MRSTISPSPSLQAYQKFSQTSFQLGSVIFISEYGFKVPYQYVRQVATTLRYLYRIVVPRRLDFWDWAIEVFRIAGNVETFHKVFVVV